MLTDREINIIEDHKSLCDTLPIILDAVESKELPRIMPTFNDMLVEETVRTILEKASGKSFD